LVWFCLRSLEILHVEAKRSPKWKRRSDFSPGTPSSLKQAKEKPVTVVSSTS
jgi:hypothetical protein